MSKPKYRQGEIVSSVCDFEKNKQHLWFKWNGKTTHRSVLISLQYRVLVGIIESRKLFYAEPIEQDKEET